MKNREGLEEDKKLGLNYAASIRIHANIYSNRELKKRIYIENDTQTQKRVIYVSLSNSH